MKQNYDKNRLKRDFKCLFESMDFIADNYLNKEGVNEKELEEERFKAFPGNSQLR